MTLKKTAVSFFQLVTSRLFVQIINFITLPVILRYFIPEEYGKVALFSSVVGAMAVLLNFTESAKSRFGREEYDKHQTFQRTFWGTILIKIPVLIIVAVLSIVYKAELLEYLGMPGSAMMLFYVVIILSFFGGNTELLVATEKFNLISLFSLSSVVIRVVTIALLILDYVQPVASYLVLMFVLNIFMKDVLVNFSSYKLMGMPKFDFGWIRSMLIFSLPFIVHFLSEKTVEYIDAIVIRKYLPFANLGVYSVAYKMFMFSIVPIELIRVMIKPRIISLYVSENMEKINWFYKEIVCQVNFFISQIFTLSIIALPLLVFFVGREYEESIYPLAVLLTCFSWIPLTNMATPMFHASKRISPHIGGNIMSAACNLGLNFVLIPRIGIIGGAVSTTISMFLSMLIHLYFLKKFFKINLFYAVIQSFPILIVSMAFVFRLHYGLVVLIYASVAITTWIAAIRMGMFTEGSLEFYNSLGLPKPFIKIFNNIYMKLVT